MNSTNVIKCLLVLLVGLYVVFFDITSTTVLFDAALTLFFSVVLLYRSRKNNFLALFSFLILYCNYSIIMGEHFIGGELAAPFFQVKTVEVYGLLVRVMLLFMGILTICYNGKSVSVDELRIKVKDNLLLFYGTIAVLVYVVIFGVNREALSSYTVRITPLYEYSTILFLLAYYYSGSRKFRKLVIIGLVLVFVLQDFYYGGRITSLQLIFFALLTVLIRKLSMKNILVFGFVGIMLNGLIGAYRKSYSLSNVSISDIFNNLVNGYFVFDTPVYAYYASATHVAASLVAPTDFRQSSLVSFLGSIFGGSSNEMSNVTKLVSNYYYQNLGGGIIPTHFYFWLGWLGVVIIALLLVVLINRAGNFKSNYFRLGVLVFLITSPRWYLYSPLILFRSLFFLGVLLLVYHLAHKIIYGAVSKNIVSHKDPSILKERLVK